MMRIIQIVSRWYRQTLRLFRTVARLPSSLNLVELTIHAFAFPQHDWAKRLRKDLASEETEITWREACNPVYWLVWFVRFLIRWAVTRPYKTLTPAIPSILVGIVLVGTVWVVFRRDSAATQTIYLDTLKTSLTSGNVELASVAAQRLISMDPDNLEHQYQLAMLNEKLGKKESARLSILRLALQKDFGPAALWILRSLVFEPQDEDVGGKDIDSADQWITRKEWTEDEQTLCHRCATIAMTNLPSERSILARKMYAEFLSKTGNIGDAIRLYDAIVEFDPSVNLIAAQLADRQGKHLEAQRFASAAVRHLEPKMLSSPTNVALRIKLAQALVLDEQDDRAFSLLVDGLKMSPNSIMLKTAAGESLIFKSARLARSLGEEETLLMRADLLIKALQLAPKSPHVLEAVVRLAIECGEADSDRLKRVREALLRGVSPAAMHFVEGTVLLMAGENDAARHHLELAQEEGTNMAGLLNNLAVALGQSGSKYLPQALRFSEEALRQLKHPYLHETRGDILLKMERYQEAIPDLEAALKAPEMAQRAHRGLAIAYKELGLVELSQQHRALAEGITSPLPTD